MQQSWTKGYRLTDLRGIRNMVRAETKITPWLTPTTQPAGRATHMDYYLCHKKGYRAQGYHIGRVKTSGQAPKSARHLPSGTTDSTRYGPLLRKCETASGKFSASSAGFPTLNNNVWRGSCGQTEKDGRNSNCNSHRELELYRLCQSPLA